MCETGTNVLLIVPAPPSNGDWDVWGFRTFHPVVHPSHRVAGFLHLFLPRLRVHPGDSSLRRLQPHSVRPLQHDELVPDIWSQQTLVQDRRGLIHELHAPNSSVTHLIKLDHC